MKILRIYACMALMALAGACGGEEAFHSAYVCADCVFQRLEFLADGTVKMTAHEVTLELPYTREGNRFVIATETADYVFELAEDGMLVGAGDVEGTYTKE